MQNITRRILPVIAFLGFLTMSRAGAENTFELRETSTHQNKVFIEMTVEDSDRKLYVSDYVLLSTADVLSASPKNSNIGTPMIEIIFTETGQSKLNEATEASIGKPMGILIDGKLVSVPVVRERITGGRVLITGTFSEEEAKHIVAGLGENN